MGFLRAIAKAAAAGMANGSLMYAVFEVAKNAGSSVNPAVGFAVGFASAVAVALFDADKENKQ